MVKPSTALKLALLATALAAAFVYFWFLPTNNDRQVVSHLTAGTTKPGITLFDGRHIEQHFSLPEEANEIQVTLQHQQLEPNKRLVLSLHSAKSEPALWSQEKEITAIAADKLSFQLLPGLLTADTPYVLKITTNGINRQDSIQLPYEYESDSSYPEGRVIISQATENDILEETNNYAGNVSLRFINNPTLRQQVSQTLTNTALPLLALAMLGVLLLWSTPPISTQSASQKISKRLIGLITIMGLALSLFATAPLYRNPSLISNHGDINRGLVFADLAQTSLRQGHLPLWNPYLCGGSPLLADLESWVLQPFTFLTLPFDGILTLKISFTLTLFTAFVGFSLLALTHFRLSTAAALVFAAIATFSGYYSQHLAEGYFVWVGAAWVPWFLLSAFSSLRNTRYVPLAGLFLAFMFGGGTMHLAIYSLLFFILILLFLPGKITPLRRLQVLSMIGLFFGIFAAIKLIPAASLLEVSESRPGLTPPLSFLPKMLFARGLVPPIKYNDIFYRWSEFGNYIGYISFALAVLGAFTYRKKTLISGALLLASAAAAIIVFLPFPATEGLLAPLVDLFRMPSRLMLFPIIGISLLAATGVDTIRKWLPSSVAILRPLLLTTIIVALSVDLVTNDADLFQRTFKVELPPIERQQEFQRVLNSYTTPDETYYRASYVDYLNNQGVNGQCRFYNRLPATRGSDSSNPKEPYLGEAHLYSQNHAQIQELSSHRIVVDVDPASTDILFLNQTYYPGWVTQEGQSAHNENGLVAVPLTAADQTVALSYKPAVAYWSLALTALATILGIIWLYTYRKPSQSP